MKKLLLLLSAGILAASCVDKDYDLTDIDTDNVTIGDENTEFKIPLATIRVRMKDLAPTGETGDIRTIFRHADTWLPTTLPDGATWVDIPSLQQAAYTDKLFDALFAEMQDPASGKLDRIIDLAWTDYRTEFEEALGITSVSAVTEALFRETFRQNYTKTAVRNEVKRQANAYLTDLDKIEPLQFDLGKIDLDSEVVDMLADNLGGKNTLHLYGSIRSSLPLAIQLDPAFRQTGVDFRVAVEPDIENGIDRVQIVADDLRTIVAGTTIDIPIRLEKYYPGKHFTEDADSEQIVLSLKLVKHGGLNLDL